MIRIGILGCGKIAQVRHIPEYAANPDCELAAFYNPTRKRAEDMAAKYGGRVYDTPEALLAAAEALGQAHGKRYMRLDCAVDSAFLNGYYESLGYRVAGQCEDGPYVGVKRQKEL